VDPGAPRSLKIRSIRYLLAPPGRFDRRRSFPVAEYIFPTTTVCNLDADELDMFLSFAHESVRCGGKPEIASSTLVGQAAASHIVQLKSAGLISTVVEGDHHIIFFTGAGSCLARDHGICLPL
jgi:hypothetical protein